MNYNEKYILLDCECCIIYAMATNERIDHLERLLEVVRGLTTAPDLESFLQSIISEATELTNSELASILEYDETAEELRFLAMQWFQRDVRRPIGGAVKAPRWEPKTREPVAGQGAGMLGSVGVQKGGCGRGGGLLGGRAGNGV